MYILFMIKILSKLGIEGNFPNMIKAIYKNLQPTWYLDIHYKLWKIENFTVRSGTRQRYQILLLLINTAFEVPASAVGQEKEIKSIHNDKK